MSEKFHPLAIDFEEHFQLASTGRMVPERHWQQLPSRMDRNTDAALRLLDRHGATATFLVGAWAAARHPAILARVAAAGHEIAGRLGPHSKAAPRDAHDSGIADLKELLEAVSGRVVHGFRVARQTGPGMFEALAGAGLRYAVADHPITGPVATAVRTTLAVLPIRCLRIAGQDWPLASGAILRQLPEPLVAKVTAHWSASSTPPIFCCKLWEFDPDQPELAVLSPMQRHLSYRNLTRWDDRFSRLLDSATFTPLRAQFGLAEEQAPLVEQAAQVAPSPSAYGESGAPITLVVPCFNEVEGLSYLANVLAELNASLGRRHKLSFVLVDDGSTDGTWAEMERLFVTDAQVRLVRHPANRGIGAAILTGVTEAQTEIVAIIDSDCSYDPARIEEMLPLLTPDVALVTASPYHADGGVAGVPEWRLVLSRGASRLYRMVLHNKLATYTSCFRICRKSALHGLSLQHHGYIGVVEMLARLDLAGWRIAEHPVVLEARLLGHSKLKILRVIAGHLQFLGEICATRLMNWGRAKAANNTR